MQTSDPWRDIGRGTGRRVDADHPGDFWWAVDVDGVEELIVNFPTLDEDLALPSLRGLKMKVLPQSVGRSRLVVRLNDRSLRDVFHRLCNDIVESSRIATNQESTARIAVRRTWRWHHLLRGGRLGLLSEEEQKGLIGEIRVLEHLLGIVGAGTAVDSWRGPLDAPKDFEIGPHAIEAKARRGAAAPKIAISSEDQLDTSGVQELLLHVVDLHTEADGQEGFTLTEAADRLRDVVRAQDEGLFDQLDDLLAAAGFDWMADYSAFRWSEGESRLYQVRSGFPRIQGSDVPAAVSQVRYQLDLNALDPYLITWDDAAAIIQEKGEHR